MKSGRWLNGWRRLWIIWAAVSVPAAFFSAAGINDQSQFKFWLDAELAANQGAYERAYERITGENINAPLRPVVAGTATGTVQDLATAGSVRLARYQAVISHPDPPLRAELDAIAREFRPKIAEAYKREQRILWSLFVFIWFAFTLGSYATGVTIAWIRRGFA